MRIMKWTPRMTWSDDADKCTDGKMLRLFGAEGMARWDSVYVMERNDGGGLWLVNPEGKAVEYSLRSRVLQTVSDHGGFAALWSKAEEFVMPRSGKVKGMLDDKPTASLDIAKVLGEAVATSVLPQVDERIDAALEGIESRVAALVAQGKAQPIVYQIQGMPEVKVDGSEHSRFGMLVKGLGALRAKDRNVLLWGEAGSGKSYAAKQFAERSGMRFGAVSFSAGVSESMFTGRFLPDETGAFRWKATPFTTLYSEGGVFCLDELDKADPQVATALNMALANGEIVTTEGAILKRHESFIVIGGANALNFSKAYAAAQPQDGSLLDRFFKVRWDLCPVLLSSILSGIAGNQHGARIIRVREAVNGALAAKRFDTWKVGMRACERMAAMAHAGFCPVEDCLRDEVEAMAPQYLSEAMSAARAA